METCLKSMARIVVDSIGVSFFQPNLLYLHLYFIHLRVCSNTIRFSWSGIWQMCFGWLLLTAALLLCCILLIGKRCFSCISIVCRMHMHDLQVSTVKMCGKALS